MDKKGFIRTLEAVIAVIVVFVFIYSVGRGGYESTREVDSIKSLQESISVYRKYYKYGNEIKYGVIAIEFIT